MTDSTAQLLRLLGYLMIGIAAVILSIALITLFQFFFSPESVSSVAVVSDFLAARVPLLMTDIRGENSSIDIDPAARLVIVYFVGAIVVMALSSIVHALVNLGLQLVRFSRRDNQASGT